jgi:hypothetical protein
LANGIYIPGKSCENFYRYETHQKIGAARTGQQRRAIAGFKAAAQSQQLFTISKFKISL